MRFVEYLVDFLLGSLGVVALIGGGALAYVMTIPPAIPGTILPAEQALAFGLGVGIMVCGAAVVVLAVRRK